MSNGIDEHGDAISPPSIRGLSRPEAPAASNTYPMPPHVRCRCEESGQRRWVCYACLIANANPPTGRPSISVGTRRSRSVPVSDIVATEPVIGARGSISKTKMAQMRKRVDAALRERISARESRDRREPPSWRKRDDETPEEEATGRALDRQRQIDAEREFAESKSALVLEAEALGWELVPEDEGRAYVGRTESEIGWLYTTSFDEDDHRICICDIEVTELDFGYGYGWNRGWFRRAEPAVVSETATTDLDDSPSDELTVGMW